MKIFFIFVFVTVFLLGALAQGTTKTLGAPKKIVILGDSLTEGYGVAQSAAFPALLQKKADQDKLNWKIIAAGSSGSTSASGLQRLKWIAKDKPDFVLLLLGSNDGLRGLKIEETEKNLNATIAYAKQSEIPIALGQLHVPPNYGKDYAKNFAALYVKVAKKNRIELAPFLLEKVAGDKNLNLADGIHPNEKGHQIIADNLYPFLKRIFNP